MKKNLKILFIVIIISLIITFLTIKKTMSIDHSETNNKIAENTEFLYYIDVNHDDSYYYNDIYEVEDKLPDFLTFIGFQKNSNGRIYNIHRTNSGGDCAGTIIGSDEGITYNEETKTVSFKFTNLGSKCLIRIALRVKTNTTMNRDDFYNSASMRSSNKYTISNSVHSYVGNEINSTKTVKYNLIGDAPSNYVIDTPSEKKYTIGQTVSLDNKINIPGYVFNGWNCNGVNVSNNTFTMPENDVICTGSFIEDNSITKHKVIYKLNVEDPENISILATKEYYAGEYVSFEPFYAYNDKIYSFDGWVVPSNITINNNLFVMPDSDVVFTGEMIKNKYKITYNFIGNILPNDINLLPEEKEYGIFDEVQEPYMDYTPTECTNTDTDEIVLCRFIGWMNNSKFFMPENDVTINGKWMSISGIFSPSIESEIVDEKSYYEKGDIVTFKTTVKNLNNINIKNVMVRTNLEGQEFIENEAYSITNKKTVATINTINSNDSVVLYSTYKVTENTNKILTNEFEIISAEGENGYYLENKVYKTSVEFNLKTSNENSGEGSSETPKDNDGENDNIPSEVKPNVPKTIDNINIYISIFSISLSILFVIIFIVIKERRKL